MSFSIAVAGKGGSGKTSLACLVIRYLLRHNGSPILAVDADPNANLGESLGLEVKETVGMMLDKFQKSKIDIPSGMTKEAYLEFKLNSLLVESQGIDLISMGRGEGQDCYCYPNLILRKFIDRLHDNYSYVILDNEAGMEHLSRGTTQDIDELLYWVFEYITFSMASSYAAMHRDSINNHRRVMFLHQLELLKKLNPFWEKRREKEIDEILKFSPYTH